jgi:hypothetical protein
MPWTSPKTWQPAEIVTAAALNAHLRDNLNYLLAARPVAFTCITGSADFSTASTTFVPVDAALTVGLTLAGSRALVIATALISGTLSGSICYADWRVDGAARAGGANGLVQSAIGTTGANFHPVTLAAVFGSLTPGVHSFQLMFRGNGTGNALVLNNGIPITLIALEV